MFWRRNRLGSRLILPTSFSQCLTYGEQVLFLQREIEDLQERVTALENVSRETQIDEEPET